MAVSISLLLLLVLENNWACFSLKRRFLFVTCGCNVSVYYLHLYLQIHSTNQNTDSWNHTVDDPPKKSINDMNDAPWNNKEGMDEGERQESTAQVCESQENEHQTSQNIKAPKEEDESSRTYSKTQKEDPGKLFPFH